MAQPSMPHGVFRGKRKGYWDWYVVDPAITDPDEKVRQWRASRAASNPPAWRWIVIWPVFAAVFCAVGIALPLLVFHAREPGSWILFVIAGVIGGFSTMIWTSEIGRNDGTVPDDPHVMQLNRNLTDWVRSTIRLEDIWDLNLEVARSTRLDRAHTGNVDDGTSAWAQEILGNHLEELRAEQRARVRVVADRVGFVIPPGGLWLDDDADVED